MNSATPTENALLAQLSSLVSAEHVLTGNKVTAFATDIYRAREIPLAVVQPGSVEELQSLVKSATGAGFALFVRGGGTSYSDSFLPTRTQSIIIDMSRLNRIVDINVGDGYVTVEAGVTWAQLKTVLDPLNVRTPFFGTFSGLMATVGGSLSQHATSHGSGAHGMTAQSLLSLEVLTANGEFIRTGSAARVAGGKHFPPHARWFGPDLAGLFAGDSGALGIKTRITLPLIKRLPAFECASFGFGDFASMATALRAAAIERLDDEHFGIDAALSQGQIARQEKISNKDAILGVWKSAPSPWAAIKQLLKMAASGTAVLQAPAYTLHYVIEGINAEDARIKLNRLRELMMAEGFEIPNTIPAVVRGMPFAPMYNALGPKGELWVPLNGILPHSEAAKFNAALKNHLAACANEMKQYGVWVATMFTSVASSGFMYDIAIYWPGKWSLAHHAIMPAEYLAQLTAYENSNEANAFVDTLKQDLMQLYGEFGGVHIQLGKTYPYADVIAPEVLALVRAIKKQLDPEGLLNPGALGL